MSDAFYIMWGLALVIIFFASQAFPRGAWQARRDFVQGWGLLALLGIGAIFLLIQLVKWLIRK
jgi:hypothetical protein